MYVKSLNSIFKSVQKKHPGKLLYFPTKISIETGNICNLRCPLCPTSDEKQSDVEKGVMCLEDFKTVFNKIRPFVKTIDLFSWGEPFLNKDVAEMIRYAKQEKNDLRIFVDSNFNAVSEEQIDGLVRYGLDVIKVSCDGVTQETYEKYRVGGNVEKVLSNVQKLIDKKRQLGSGKPNVIWKYLVFKHNRHEVELARKKASDMEIEFEDSGMRVDCGKEIFEDVKASVERDSEWIPDDEKYNNYADLKTSKSFCEKPWRTLTVNWDGEVVPCGAIYDCQKYSFGNLLEQSFEDVWNGDKFVMARQVILDKLPDESKLICSVCKRNGYQFF